MAARIAHRVVKRRARQAHEGHAGLALGAGAANRVLVGRALGPRVRALAASAAAAALRVGVRGAGRGDVVRVGTGGTGAALPVGGGGGLADHPFRGQTVRGWPADAVGGARRRSHLVDTQAGVAGADDLAPAVRGRRAWHNNVFVGGADGLVRALGVLAANARGAGKLARRARAADSALGVADVGAGGSLVVRAQWADGARFAHVVHEARGLVEGTRCAQVLAGRASRAGAAYGVRRRRGRLGQEAARRARRGHRRALGIL